MGSNPKNSYECYHTMIEKFLFKFFLISNMKIEKLFQKIILNIIFSQILPIPCSASHNFTLTFVYIKHLSFAHSLSIAFLLPMDVGRKIHKTSSYAILFGFYFVAIA